jgi:hypothetical protein
MFELVPGEINVFAVYIVVNVLCNFSDEQALLDITSEYGLTQIHDKPTRAGNMFTNNPSLIKTTGNAPGISDPVYIVVNVLCNFSDVGFDFLPVCFGEDISLLWLLFTVVWFNHGVGDDDIVVRDYKKDMPLSTAWH